MKGLRVASQRTGPSVLPSFRSSRLALLSARCGGRYSSLPSLRAPANERRTCARDMAAGRSPVTQLVRELFFPADWRNLPAREGRWGFLFPPVPNLDRG